MLMLLICKCYVIQKSSGDAVALAVWMANSSEMLHFFSCDVDVAPVSAEAQNLLAECVQHAFLLLVDALQNRLHQTMPAFVSTSPDADSAPGKHCFVHINVTAYLPAPVECIVLYEAVSLQTDQF